MGLVKTALPPGDGDWVVVTRRDGVREMARFRGVAEGVAVGGERVAWVELELPDGPARLVPIRSIRLARPAEIAQYLRLGDC